MINKYRLREVSNKHSLNHLSEHFDLTADYKLINSLGINSTREFAYLSQILMIDLRVVLSAFNEKYRWVNKLEETPENLVLIDAKNLIMKEVRGLNDFHISLKLDDFTNYIKVFNQLKSYKFPTGSILDVSTVNSIISEEYTNSKKHQANIDRFRNAYGIEYSRPTPMWNKLRFEKLCEVQLFKLSIFNYLLDLCNAHKRGLVPDTFKIKKFCEESKNLKKEILHLLMYRSAYVPPETWRVRNRFGTRDAMTQPITSSEDYVRVLKYQIERGQIDVNTLSDGAIRMFHSCDELEFLIEHDGYDRVSKYFRFCVSKRRESF